MKKKLAILLACVLMLTAMTGMAISAAAADSPEATLPPVLIQGFTYALPELEGQRAYVNGVEGGTFFVAEGAQVVIEYKASETAVPAATYTIPVVDTQNSANHCAYFYSTDGVAAEETADYIALSCSSDGETLFANALNANAFAVNMEFAAEASEYRALELTLTDASDRSVSLTVQIDPNENTLSLGEQTSEFSGSMLLLKYTNLDRTLQDASTGEAIFAFTTDDNGETFSGFSGGVYMTLRFRDVSGNASVYLKRLVNQPLGHRDEQIADQTEPTIALSQALSSKLTKGMLLELPAANCYDVFSEVVRSTVSVTSPAGTELYSGDYAGYTPCEITENGKYTVVYRAEDSHGNVAELSRTLSVNDDTAPELSVSELSKTAYQLGDTVELPAYTVGDGLENYTVDTILILPNCELRLLAHDVSGAVTYYTRNTNLYLSSFGVSDTSFRTEQTGRYTLRFVAYDELYNRTVVELPFVVE